MRRFRRGCTILTAASALALLGAPLLPALPAPAATAAPGTALHWPAGSAESEVSLGPDVNYVRDIAIDSVAHIAYIADSIDVLAVDELTKAVTSLNPHSADLIMNVAVDHSAGHVYAVAVDPYGVDTLITMTPAGGVQRSAPIPGGATSAAVWEHAGILVLAGYNAEGTGGTGHVSLVAENTGDLLATINVGRDPEAVAVDQSTGTIYVCNEIDGTVSVIDGDSRMVVATLPVGAEPVGVGVDSRGHVAVVASGYSDSLALIGTTLSPLGGPPSFSVNRTLALAGAPWGVSVDTDAHTAYVTQEGGYSVTLVDTVTGAIDGTLPLPGAQPMRIAVDAQFHAAYTIRQNDGALSVTMSAIEMNTGDPADAHANVRYSFTMSASGSPAPRFSVLTGTLPPGLTLDPATGVLAGTPTRGGTFWFTLSAHNEVAPDADTVYAMRVSKPCLLGWCG